MFGLPRCLLKKVFWIVILAAVIVVSAVALLSDKEAGNKAKPRPSSSEAKAEKKRVTRKGEKVVYDVMLGKLPLGRAVFVNEGDVLLGDKPAELLIAETTLARFKDKEEIYSDPDSFLPILVKRDISTWPFPEKITETYDQKDYSVTIEKTKAGRTSRKVIKKGSPLNNAILLPYYVRLIDKIKEGYSTKANLPTAEFIIKLAGKEEVSVPAGTFPAYRFISSPSKFEIWISADERRVPLKIKGTTAVGYVLEMKEYAPGGGK